MQNWKIGPKLLLGTYSTVVPLYFVINYLAKREKRLLAEAEGRERETFGAGRRADSINEKEAI